MSPLDLGFGTLQTLLKECEHKVIMSAQADQLVKDYLDDCRVIVCSVEIAIGPKAKE